MKDLTLKELEDLVISELPDSEKHIQQMFDWHFQRDMTITKWVLGAAASLFIAVLIAFFRGELTVAWWQPAIVILSSILSFIYGISRLIQMRNLHKQFVSSLRLLTELKKILPFIKKYREALM